MVPDIFVSSENSSGASPATSSGNNLSSSHSSSLRHIPGELLSAYAFMPTNMHFETQEPGETIILLLRRHFITNVPWLLLSILLILTPIIFFSQINLDSVLPSFFPASFVTLIILSWYVLTFGFILTQFLLWYFNVWIVTDERVVDIDFNNLLYKSISETRIAKIEDVTEKTTGFIRALFDYGDVFVQTAGTAENFEFYGVPHPGEVVKTINQLMGNEEEEGET